MIHYVCTYKKKKEKKRRKNNIEHKMILFWLTIEFKKKNWSFYYFDKKWSTIYCFFPEVADMHKSEIAEENDELKHHIQCYDSKFLRAHNRLNKLRQEYSASKQYLPPKRYRLLKEMIETVVEDSKLKPDWFMVNLKFCTDMMNYIYFECMCLEFRRCSFLCS